MKAYKTLFKSAKVQTAVQNLQNKERTENIKAELLKYGMKTIKKRKCNALPKRQ